jgi:hypothetical protein
VLRRSIAISPTCDELLELISYPGVLSSKFWLSDNGMPLTVRAQVAAAPSSRTSHPTSGRAYFRPNEEVIKKSWDHIATARVLQDH